MVKRSLEMDDLDVTVRRLERPEDTEQAYCCMTEVPTPWPQALCSCRDWMSQNLGRHVEGYHLFHTGGGVIGHLYYAMSGQALIPYQVESDVAIMYCEWVQHHYQKQGYGRFLFETFLDDMEQSGAKGILVEGSDLEQQMHIDHYLPRGFTVVHQSGQHKLLYRPISQEAISIQPLHVQIQPRSGVPVEIMVLSGYMCPYEVATLVHLRQVAQEFGDQVVLRQLSLTSESLHQYGAAQGIFINGRQKLKGAETEEAVRQAILEEFSMDR